MRRRKQRPDVDRLLDEALTELRKVTMELLIKAQETQKRSGDA